MRDDLIERLRSVKWEVTADGDRMPDDPTHLCVFVDMRPDEFESLLSEVEATLATMGGQGEDDAWCAECGVKLELVRPGKHQHPTCSQATPTPQQPRKEGSKP